jgi:ribosomal protein S18 acetylase RimI-like enzyme
LIAIMSRVGSDEEPSISDETPVDRPRPHPVRQATEQDLDRLVALFAAVAGEGRWIATELPFDRREVRARWSALLSTGEGTLLLTEQDGAPTGLAAVVGRRPAELGMVVARDLRGQGIGAALLQSCIRWARDQGAPALTLHVFPHNDAAIRLYQRHGFAEQRRLHAHYPRRSGERWDALVMSLDLRPERP